MIIPMLLQKEQKITQINRGKQKESFTQAAEAKTNRKKRDAKYRASIKKNPIKGTRKCKVNDKMAKYRASLKVTPLKKRQRKEASVRKKKREERKMREVQDRKELKNDSNKKTEQKQKEKRENYQVQI